jgi:hypothetical protein
VKVLWLVAVTLGVVGAALTVAVLADGSEHWLPGGVAVVLCLFPAVGTLVAAQMTERRTPVASIGFILVAPLIRLILVLAVGGLLGMAVPGLRASPARFAFWVAGCYLVTLVVETTVLLVGARPHGPPTNLPTDT